MTSRTIRFLVLTLTLIVSLNAVSYAEISNAAMLFLRIAPGARAAGMGEAYVAVADDATASHWNPAGLGAFPLAATWLDSEIPMHLRPIIDVAAVRLGRANNYLDYELWAITSQGLRRYDNRSWHDSELFSVPSTSTLEQFVGRYFGLVDDDAKARVAHRVAIANNAGSAESLEALRDSVLSRIPDTYGPKERIIAGFDSLSVGFNQCRIDWSYVEAIKKHLADGLKDDELSEREMDRINVAIERAHLRYIKEEINIPFTALFETPLTALESNGEVLLVSSENGLFQMRRSVWRRLTVEDGLPSENVFTLKAISSGHILIGTDKGIAVHDGNLIKLLATEGELPDGAIEAIGASSLSDIWVVVNQDLYHFDGSTWSNYRTYTVVLDDDIDAIADKFHLYGSATEALAYKTKLAGIDQYIEPAIEVEVVEDKPIGVAPGETVVVIDSIAAPEPVDTVVVEEVVEAPEPEFVALPDTLEPGKVIRIPYVAGIKGEVYDLHVQNNGVVWFATEYGIIRYSYDGWEIPGWKETPVDSTVTWDNLVARRTGLDSAFAAVDETVREAYLEAVRDLNDLDGSPLREGQTVLLYNHPNAYPTYLIAESGDNVFFATETGLLQHNADGWERAGFKGLGNSGAVNILTVENEIWFFTDDRIIAKGRGKTEYTLMHANWLPSLADDLFYDYVGFVTSSEGIGTFGGNFTFISYGSFVRTDATGVELGTFDAFEAAFTLAYGTSLTKRLKGGVSAKLINSHLSEFGAGEERGNGITWAFALDFGIMYQITSRLNLGLAVTNLGPDVQYSDNPQQDALPRNIACGLAWNAYQSDAMNLLVVAEANKSLVDIGDPRAQEIREIIWSGGIELDYLKLIALRAGYYHDELGQIKNLSFGAGLTPMDLLKFDFAYIPSNRESSLANTLRLSLTITP